MSKPAHKTAAEAPPAPSALELAALISSRICHDVIGPIGAINNGLEILAEEEDDPKARGYALDVIRNVTGQASARVEFARFAYGAAGSAGSQIDLGMAEKISRAFVGTGKHKLAWKCAPGQMAKDKVKLLLNLVASSLTALPRGGDIEVAIVGSLENPSFLLRCRGQGARPPQYLVDFLYAPVAPAIDPLSVQAYYTCLLATTARLKLEILKDGSDIVLAARPLP